MKKPFRLGIAAIVLTAFNLSAATRYVWQDSPSPGPPYTNWATAARVIQDAVDAALPGDEIVVTNGIYTTGGRAVGTNLLVNRVAVDKPLTLRSVNGPEFTVIRGYQVPGTTNGDGGIRCVYLASGASLSGFLLTNGAAHGLTEEGADDVGGGLWCESTHAVVSNCVLTGNSARFGGGAFGGTLYSCTLAANSGGWMGGGVHRSALYNCTLTDNWAGSGGGGASFSTLNKCTLTGNSAGREGGGAANCTLANCILNGNSGGQGGGAYWSTLNNCALTGNSAWSGGGASGGVLNNCTVTGNSASQGGGVSSYFHWWAEPVTLNNCIVYYNTAPIGANFYGSRLPDNRCTLNYCCTTPLPESWVGVGNISVDPQLASAGHLSANSPCRGAGSASFTTGVDIDGEVWSIPPSIGCNEYHAGAVTGPLSVGIVAGCTNVAVGFPVDLTALIQGRTTTSAWDFGDSMVVSNRPHATHAWTAPGDYAVVLRAYNESLPGGVSAAVTVHVTAPIHFVAIGSTNPLPPYTSWLTAATSIQDAVDAATLPGALVLVTNGIYASGGRAVVGAMTNRVAVDKPLTLQSVNGPEVTIIQGHQVPGTTNGDGAIRCVYLTNGASLSGFTLTRGATRAVSDEPYLESSGGGVWCEWATAVLSNCVLIGNSADSLGGGAYSGALNNCTLTRNSAGYQGGGAYYGRLNNCTLSGNSAGYQGGGAYRGTLNNCTLAGNSADEGGGAYEGTLYNCIATDNRATGASSWSGGGAAYRCALNNCTLTGNLAENGGGALWSTLNNCTVTGNSAVQSGGGANGGWLDNSIVYYNTAPNGPNYYSNPDDPITFNASCTAPLPFHGVGNIINAPLFVNYAGGNLRLQSNSPCINAGLNAYAPGTTDLDGLPRIVSGMVDIGAYEYQGIGSLISYAWLQQYNLPTDGSADATDLDADGHNTWQEWRCQTCPTNALSALRLLSATRAGTNVIVSWQSVSGVNYFLERSTNLLATPPFTQLAPNIPGQPGTTSFTDTNAAFRAPLFYRVGVEP